MGITKKIFIIGPIFSLGSSACMLSSQEPPGCLTWKHPLIPGKLILIPH